MFSGGSKGNIGKKRVKLQNIIFVLEMYFQRLQCNNSTKTIHYYRIRETYHVAVNIDLVFLKSTDVNHVLQSTSR